MDMLRIERVGGFAGFGLPGSKLQSGGDLPVSALSPRDQAAVAALFETTAQSGALGVGADAFRYRITRMLDGHERTVEVSEAAVPSALKACVTDRLL